MNGITATSLTKSNMFKAASKQNFGIFVFKKFVYQQFSFVGLAI